MIDWRGEYSCGAATDAFYPVTFSPYEYVRFHRSGNSWDITSVSHDPQPENPGVVGPLTIHLLAPVLGVQHLKSRSLAAYFQRPIFLHYSLLLWVQ